jgi:hypothetical protein
LGPFLVWAAAVGRGLRPARSDRLELAQGIRVRAITNIPLVILLIAVAFVASCGPSSSVASAPSSTSTAPPTAIPSALPTATPPTAYPVGPTPTPAATVGSSEATSDTLVGTVVVTVSDRLRVRSEPRVSDDSIKYEPVLPLGTLLTVLDGPVLGSGYTWYMVAPTSFAALEGPGYGWVAMAGKDGERWFAPLPAPALVYAGTDENYVVNGMTLTRHLLSVANRYAYPAEMFALSPDLPPCGLNDNASRTWVEIYDAGTDGRINGFCGIAAPQGLADLWFAFPLGTESPTAVYVTLIDRRLDLVLRSNAVAVPLAETTPVP